jgi:hypothetical protein
MGFIFALIGVTLLVVGYFSLIPPKQRIAADGS